MSDGTRHLDPVVFLSVATKASRSNPPMSGETSLSSRQSRVGLKRASTD